MFERRPAIEAEAGHSKYRELDREHLALFAGRVVSRSAVNRSHGAVWKDLSVKPGGILGCAVIPKTNYVFGHRLSPLVRLKGDPSSYDDTATTDSTAGLGLALRQKLRLVFPECWVYP